MIVKTDAVVLHARRIRESSKILTLYTREYGKMSVMGRGVMAPKSKYGSVLQPMGYLSVVFYRKEGRDLQNLSSAESIERFPILNADLERMTTGLAVVEIVNAVMHDENRHEEIFDLLVQALRALNDPESDERAVGLWFHIRLAADLGYALSTRACGVCGETFDTERSPLPYSLALGAPLCAEHQASTPYRPLRDGTFRLLRALLNVDLAEASAIRTTPPEAVELQDILSAFLRFHVEGLRKLKVRAVGAQVLQAEANGPEGV